MIHDQSLYQRLAGEPGLRAVVEAFYDLIEQDPRFERLHRLHLRGHGVAHSRHEQFDFLSGFLGGPRLYVERHGHSRLREIHAHVPIDAEMRDLWLEGMRLALDRAGVTGSLAEALMRHLGHAAEMARNLPPICDDV